MFGFFPSSTLVHVVTRVLYAIWVLFDAAQVHEVQIGSHGEISPEVKAIRLNDAVAWTFDLPKQNDVHQLIGTSTDDESGNDSHQLAGDVVPHRCVALWMYDFSGMQRLRVVTQG